MTRALATLCMMLLLAAPALATDPVVLAPGPLLTLETELMTLAVDRVAGRLHTLRLNSEKFRDDLLALEKRVPAELDDLELSFTARSGSLEVAFDETRPAAWTVGAESGRSGARELVIATTLASAPAGTTGETGIRVAVKKTLTIPPNSHRLHLALKFRNESAQAVTLGSASGDAGFSLGLIPTLGESSLDDSAIFHRNGAFESHAFTKAGVKVEADGDFRFAGVMDTFFLAVLEFAAAKPVKLLAETYEAPGFDLKKEGHAARIVATFAKLELDPGEAKTLEFDLVIAKKSYHLLSQYKLEEACGMSFLSVTIMNVLFFFHGLAGNWGLAIILLTLAVRIILYPLNAKQARSMKAMSKIQPLLKELQVKYADDQTRQSQEMMKLYKEHNINPLSGCLPLLIQIPILIALFTSLRSSIELRGVSFFWLPDLAGGDPFYVLPLIIAVTMQIQQGQMNTDPNQQAAMRFMPFLMFFLCMSLPAGVLVYWLVSNVLQIIQQAYDPSPKPAPAFAPADNRK